MKHYSNYITKHIFTALLCLCSATSLAQKPVLGLEYTGELQANLKGRQVLDDETEIEPFNFMNHLKLTFDMDFGKHFGVHAATLSMARTSKERIAADFQWFSNIDEDNLPLALAVLGFDWRPGEYHTLFAGIRNMNEDYFTGDVTSFFTTSSGGCHPTIAFNYPIANYPFASMGIHYAYDTEHLGIQASLYNGEGFNKFSGKENVFRFCPADDGIFAIAQGEYRHRGSRYFLGGCLAYNNMYGWTDWQAKGTLWAYAEQKLCRNLYAIAAYSHAFAKKEPASIDGEELYNGTVCSDYAALGAKMDIRKVEIGVLANYARFLTYNEWDTEISCKATLTRHIYIQPTIHLIKNSLHTDFVGTLRFGVSL